jgi:hypothetical protein
VLSLDLLVAYLYHHDEGPFYHVATSNAVAY